MTRLHDVTLGKFDQFKRVMAAAGLDGELIDAIVRQPSLGVGMVEWAHVQLNTRLLSFAKFDQYLLTLDQQLARIRDYNSRFWDNRLTAEQLDAVDTTSTHIQKVDDLEILHVSFGTPEDDVDLWWKVIAGVQPITYLEPNLSTNSENLRVHGFVKLYPRGIHRVHIDLMANWSPKFGIMIPYVRATAPARGKFLAHAEVLSVYGVHAELLREQDGKHLPRAYMAGYQSTPLDRLSAKWEGVPCLWSERFGDELQVRIIGPLILSRLQHHASPEVWE